MNNTILTIDQGTTNTKVHLVGKDGNLYHKVSRPVSQQYPKPGWIEQDATELWQSVVQAIRSCLEASGGVEPAGIAITNQRESALVWERESGKPAGPVITWQCRRTAPFCKRLKEQGLEDEIRHRTGLGIDPLFSASKIRWLLDNIPNGRERAGQAELCAGTVDSWLLWNLTSGRKHACDVSNASRTQLLNLESLKWDDRMLDIFDVPRPVLPKLTSSNEITGETNGVDGIPDGIPVASMIGDSHAALFGQSGFRPGKVKATYGTGSSVMSSTPELVAGNQSLSSTVAWGIGEKVVYALEGNITSAGATVHWFADLLGMDTPERAAELASEVDDSEGVYIVPAFAGLGAPYWRDDVRGMISGLTRGTTAAHIARAAIESMAFQVCDVFSVMDAAAETDLELLLADGGGSRNDRLMQFQANILGHPVHRNNASQIASLGTAYLAGLALGIWKDLDEIDSLPKNHDQFEPSGKEEFYETKYEEWQDAVSRLLHQPDREKEKISQA